MFPSIYRERNCLQALLFEHKPHLPLLGFFKPHVTATLEMGASDRTWGNSEGVSSTEVLCYLNHRLL